MCDFHRRNSSAQFVLCSMKNLHRRDMKCTSHPTMLHLQNSQAQHQAHRPSHHVLCVAAAAEQWHIDHGSCKSWFFLFTGKQPMDFFYSILDDRLAWYDTNSQWPARMDFPYSNLDGRNAWNNTDSQWPARMDFPYSSLDGRYAWKDKDSQWPARIYFFYSILDDRNAWNDMDSQWPARMDFPTLFWMAEMHGMTRTHSDLQGWIVPTLFWMAEMHGMTRTHSGLQGWIVPTLFWMAEMHGMTRTHSGLQGWIFSTPFWMAEMHGMTRTHSDLQGMLCATDVELPWVMNVRLHRLITGKPSNVPLKKGIWSPDEGSNVPIHGTTYKVNVSTCAPYVHSANRESEVLTRVPMFQYTGPHTR